VLAVSEIFGPTYQGEGSTAGRRCSFLRLAGCNLHCSWCDTPYSWDWTRFDRHAEVSTLTVEEVASRLPHADRLVVTGGEPLLQTRALRELLPLLMARGWTIEVETAGTLSPAPLVPYVDQWNVSPKLLSSGNDPGRAFVPEVLREFRRLPNVCWKFVCGSVQDVTDAANLIELVDVHPSVVWIQPEGTDPEAWLASARLLAPVALSLGMNLSPRLHALLWGPRRGV
jgi:organic radical activating enzyme